MRTVGITGTAGKSTTASLAVQLLQGAGVPAHASRHARLGHLWAADDLVADLDLFAAGDVVVLELTSSHLAFMSSSPDVAVVTSFWPDHLELHGSAAAYRAAKETIVRHQRPDGAVVVNADDPAARSFAELTPARRYAFSTAGDVRDGAFARDGVVVVRSEGRDVEVGPLTSSTPLSFAVLGACATAVAAGAEPERLVGGLDFLTPPPHRQETLGFFGDALVVDDGMAATPSKARAALAVCPDDSVVLIAGGRLQTDGGDAHASPEERALLGAFCDEAVRTVRLAILFGEAADRLECKLVPRGVDTRTVRTLDEAVPVALAAAPGSRVVLFAPVYPLSLEEREAFPEIVREAAGAGLVRDSRQ